MNYRHNGLDIFGSLTYNKYAYYQKSPIIQTLQGRQLLLLEQNSEFTGSQDNLYANLGSLSLESVPIPLYSVSVSISLPIDWNDVRCDFSRASLLL